MLSLFPISKYLDFSTLRRINFKEIGQILPILTIIIIRANRTNHFSLAIQSTSPPNLGDFSKSGGNSA